MQRTARIDGRTKNYEPSRSELLLEEVCESFGAKLGDADFQNGAYRLLTRISTPAVLAGRLLRFQHTRFSPLYAPNERLTEIYTANNSRRRKLDQTKIIEKLEDAIQDPFAEVTDMHVLQHFTVHRFPKGIYMAVYDQKDARYPDDPISIYDEDMHDVDPPGSPELFIHWNRVPIFTIGQRREPTQALTDTITVTLPAVRARIDNTIKLASLVHNAVINGSTQVTNTLTIPTGASVEGTMGLLRTMVYNWCTGRTY